MTATGGGTADARVPVGPASATSGGRARRSRKPNRLGIRRCIPYVQRPTDLLGGDRSDDDPNDGDDHSGAVSSATEGRPPGEVGGGHRGTLHSALRGAAGGFAATVVMTVFRIPIFRALPPTSELWAQYVGGGEAEEYTVPGYVLHLTYGTVAGSVLGTVFPSIDRRSPLRTEVTALLSGVVFGTLLSVFGVRVVFAHLLHRELDEEHVLVFHVAHVVYGLTIGMWLGEREHRGEVYESPRDGEGSRA